MAKFPKTLKIGKERKCKFLSSSLALRQENVSWLPPTFEHLKKSMKVLGHISTGFSGFYL